MCCCSVFTVLDVIDRNGGLLNSRLQQVLTVLVKVKASLFSQYYIECFHGLRRFSTQPELSMKMSYLLGAV